MSLPSIIAIIVAVAVFVVVLEHDHDPLGIDVPLIEQSDSPEPAEAPVESAPELAEAEPADMDPEPPVSSGSGGEQTTGFDSQPATSEDADVAQGSEQAAHNRQVAGSSPAVGTNDQSDVEPTEAPPRYSDFFLDVLRRLALDRGIVLDDLGEVDRRVALLCGWARGEEPAEFGFAFNPLNTTFDVPGAVSANSVGVKDYPDYETGVQATYATLSLHFYSPIVELLLEAEIPAVDIWDAQVDAAIVASPWGTRNPGPEDAGYCAELVPTEHRSASN